MPATSEVPDHLIHELSPYHYLPTRWITILFLGLFTLSTVTHLGQSIRYRRWWLLPTIVLAGILEICGWGARLWSNLDILNGLPFKLQIIFTIIGPTPLIAANFIILGSIVGLLGSSYSRLNPKQYSLVFLSADIVSLIVQGAGGGLAATSDTPEGSRQGANIMLGGIGFQLFAVTIYIICAIEFFWRYFSNSPIHKVNSNIIQPPRGVFTQKIKLMVCGLGFSTLVLVIRGIYRFIELVDGWDGRIISTELYFNVLDGAMIVLAFYTINFMHPGRLLSGPYERVTDAEMQALKNARESPQPQPDSLNSSTTAFYA